MQVRFLCGPAGSGKSFRCLAEVRDVLRTAPEGPPLIFIAPKQATFQLERQLLADGAVKGYTRLHILSFERLAHFIFDRLNVAPPKLLSDEGRVMVLRALLLRHESELKLFRGSARRAGFAQEISALLSEFQQHQLSPSKLRALAENRNLRAELRDKLRDLALLDEKYAAWLAENGLQDGDRLLDAATELLRVNPPHPALGFSALWLDGFAEMTPQELDLLAAVLRFCDQAALAFCLDAAAESSWLSIWNAVGKTFQQCRQRVTHLPDCHCEEIWLPRDPEKSRFGQSPVLRDLEMRWEGGKEVLPVRWNEVEAPSLQIAACSAPETEAVFAAREILKFVRAGNRFRDCAVLVRSLEPYHKSLARIFRRYGIPFFLDRREGVAHHPLAELTRNAVRTVAFEWRHEDWFATLKTGFCAVVETEIDRLENEALARGWRGRRWREPIQIADDPQLEERLENLRRQILPPFEVFNERLAALNLQPTGRALATFLRDLWNALGVEETLERQSAEEENQNAGGSRRPSVHGTVWDQMNLWLDNVELAFASVRMNLRDWLPVLDAGLANLTVGIIPPAVDEVLVGAVDRARNPELKFCLVLGVNEAVFPAAPISPAILTDADRDELKQLISLGGDLRERLARERYYGYIAFTRASERLAVVFSGGDAEGNPMNESAFVTRLRNLFPDCPVESFENQFAPDEMVTPIETIPLLVQIADLPPAGSERILLSSPMIDGLMDRLRNFREADPEANLSSGIAEKLYGNVLKTSISRLEEFAQCPFKFFIRSGLRAGERKAFELDARERGTFQHDVLKLFHEQLVAENKRWRDLTPIEARERIGRIAAGLAADFREGLLRDSPQTRFAARMMTESLQDFVQVIVSWMHRQYHFDPAAVELDFGGDTSPMPAWEIDLGGGRSLALRGRIDRIDLCRDPKSREALAVVLDYKSSGKRLEAVLMENGVQLQLAAYLNALVHLKDPRTLFGVEKLVPAGVFYVNLRGRFENGETRADVLASAEESRRAAYRHTGRFDAGALGKLDSAGAADQFNYRLNQDGLFRKRAGEAIQSAEFERLLDSVEEQLRRIGREIFSGMARVDPYRKGRETPCGFCDYRAACRIDPWTHRYRALAVAKAGSTE